MSDPHPPRLRALSLASAPLLAGLLLVGCSDNSTATATGDGTAVTTDDTTADSTDASMADAEHDQDHGSDTTAADHDHGSDTTAAEHDHGSDASSAEHDHGDGALDVEALHDLDDELASGTLDATAQRAVVADYITQVEALKPAAGSPEADLLKLLQDLDAALAAGDLTKAAPLAAQAHDAAHELG